MQLGVALRNARVLAFETTIGPSPLLRIYSGAKPTDCATAASGTLLIEDTLPADWLAAPADGSTDLVGTWTATAIAGAPTDAGYFRIYDAAATTCHLQGTVGTGASADLIMASIAITAGQGVTITQFDLTDGND